MRSTSLINTVTERERERKRERDLGNSPPVITLFINMATATRGSNVHATSVPCLFNVCASAVTTEIIETQTASPVSHSVCCRSNRIQYRHRHTKTHTHTDTNPGTGTDTDLSLAPGTLSPRRSDSRGNTGRSGRGDQRNTLPSLPLSFSLAPFFLPPLSSQCIKCIILSHLGAPSRRLSEAPCQRRGTSDTARTASVSLSAPHGRLGLGGSGASRGGDRKSTRLNSSHL